MVSLNLWDIQTWSFVVTVSVLYCGLLLANAMRLKISCVKKSLIPSPVLAGFIVLAINSIWKLLFNSSLLSIQSLESLTYHCLGLGFVAVSLKTIKKVASKKIQKDYFETGLMAVSSYLVQGIVGISITIALSYIFINVFPASGLILPMGFAQGPGQAFTWGKNYENLWGFKNGGSFGLTIAALGFISASVGGIIYLKGMQKRGKISLDKLGSGSEALLRENFAEPNEIPDADSVDKLSIQVGLVFLGYFITYLIMQGLYKIFLLTGNAFLLNTVNPLVWGFSFLIGTVIAVVMKNTLKKLNDRKIIKRVYTSNYLLSRVSGLFFDLMVVASITAIDLSAFKTPEFILPLILISLFGSIATYWQIKIASKKLFPDYCDEQFLAMYGMNTGTASTAMVLLREIDPNLTTPASNNIVFQALYAIFFGFPMLLLLGFAPRSLTWSWVTLGLCIILLIIMQVLSYREFIFKKKVQKNES